MVATTDNLAEKIRSPFGPIPVGNFFLYLFRISTNYYSKYLRYKLKKIVYRSVLDKVRNEINFPVYIVLRQKYETERIIISLK